LLRLQLPACAGRSARYKSPQRAAGGEPRRLCGHGVFAHAGREWRPAVHEIPGVQTGRSASTIGQSRSTRREVPPGWAGQETLYKAVVQKYCRTCHVAVNFIDQFSGDLAFRRVSDFDEFGFELAHRACGTDGGEPRMRWSMPNSKVTF